MTQATGPVAKKMRETLETALAPDELDIVDDSDRHAGHLHRPGHAGPGGETHFTVRIVAQAFAGLGRVARHRRVNDLLADELRGRVHALAIEARAPGEADPRAKRALSRG